RSHANTRECRVVGYLPRISQRGVAVGTPPGGATAGRAGMIRSSFRHLIDQAVPIALFIATWQFLPSAGLVDPAILPAPVLVGKALWQLGQTKSFYTDLGMTLWRGFAGLIVGAGLGIPLGVLMATSPRAHAFFDPLVKATYSLPKTALVPLFILWFGIG